MRRIWLCLLLLAGCAPSRQVQVPAPAPTQQWLAAVVAGDGSLPVFDNATGQLMQALEQAGTPPDTILRFSAAPAMLAQPRVMLASRARVLDAIAAMRPAPGQACLVFLTSHGAHGSGVLLAPRTEFVSPADLDEALQAGCGEAPTVAIVSACYTGAFARPPMARPNRIILTAARADRPSFGCGAGRELTYYDSCLLRTLDGHPHDWAQVITGTDACVTRTEQTEHDPASDPQSSIGAAVAGLPVVGG